MSKPYIGAPQPSTRPWNDSSKVCLDIFCAAIQGFCANPNFDPAVAGAADEAVNFADKIVLVAVYDQRVNPLESAMKIHSEKAWNIAALYRNALASETRDLAAHIDKAIEGERERCAKIAEHLNGWGSAILGDERAAELAEHIAKVIRDSGTDNGGV